MDGGFRFAFVVSFFPFVNSAAPVGFVKLNVDISFDQDLFDKAKCIDGGNLRIS